MQNIYVHYLASRLTVLYKKLSFTHLIMQSQFVTSPTDQRNDKKKCQNSLAQAVIGSYKHKLCV